VSAILLDTTAVEEALAPLRVAKSMPPDIYTSPEIFALERERLFLRHWFFLCREDQLAAAGDYRAFDTPGGPIFLIRGKDMRLRAFANFCRHRGSLLVQGEGNTGGRIVCPYHAWSYFSDGRLYGCPDMQDAEGFDRTENGLVPLSLESWAGFVFASFSRDPLPLAEHLGDLPRRFASHRLDRMRCTWRMEVSAKCNWKLVLENAMETYHTGTVHRNSVGAQEQRPIPTIGNWHCMQVLSARSIATLDESQAPFPPIEGLDDDARQGTYFTVIHPSCQFAVAQDSMWWLNVTPVTHARSRVEIGGCFPQDVLALPDFRERAHAYEHRWETVLREDLGILERQQIALTSALFRPGPLSGRDDMVQSVGRWSVERLLARR
jgi:phenylpropionate dioxygenase-like ring-hydroxylating dioxygenase large terminal subunit